MPCEVLDLLVRFFDGLREEVGLVHFQRLRLDPVIAFAREHSLFSLNHRRDLLVRRLKLRLRPAHAL